IGWIGLPATMPYLRRLQRPLQTLRREIPDLQIRIISSGVRDLGPLQVEAVQWTAEIEVPALKRLQVELAPLLDDAWTRGKCARRLTQYMAAGVPAVASPVGAQAESVERGAALPAGSDAEWVEAVQKILADKEFAAQLTARAAQLVRERFDATSWAEPLRA